MKSLASTAPSTSAVLAGLAALFVSASASAGPITTFVDRSNFNAAVGTTTLETFGPSYHFPISTGVLNSATNLPGIGITPGYIQEGVTYSTPVGNGNFFNIDFGGLYSGGFLDGFSPSTRDVTITFDNSLAAFGFDIGGLGSLNFDVTIHFTSGPDQTFNNLYPATLKFFGWQSSGADIASVTVSNNGGQLGFDFDNFTYGGQGSGHQVPLPGTLPLCLLALAVMRRARR